MATATTTSTALQRGTMLTSRNAQPPAPAPATPLAPSARPYKDFLTPALHRRFTNAAFLTLAICWLQATLISSSPSWLFFWCPIGITGLRTLLLCGPALAVFIVRVMNMHIGQRTTTSTAETWLHILTSLRSVGTVAWYIFSAWLFGEVYIWSRSESAGLGWVDVGRAYERPRVNENPVFLRNVFVTLAVVQALLHLLRDYDTVPIEERKNEQEQEASKIPEPIRLLLAQSTSILGRVAKLAIPVPIFSIPLYYGFVRRPAWNSLVYPFARALIRHLPPNNGPTGLAHVPKLAWQAFTSSALLVALWELSNAVFTIYVSQIPLKKGQPLTSEIKDARGVVLSRSKDPNGSLIRGFKAKKDVPRTFAFWELHLICTSFEARRKTIFAEVDRKDGSTWSQVSKFCLTEIAAISTRIKHAQEPTEYQKKSAESALQRQQQQHLVAQQQQRAPGLPKIANQQVFNDRDVLQKSAGKRDIPHLVGNLAKSFGSSPDQKNPMMAYSRQAIDYSLERSGGKDAWSREGLQGSLRSHIIDFLKTPFGEPFRQTFARRVKSAIFGIPNSNAINIIHASRSLTGLAVASLKEDNFGQASKDIGVIVRTYTVVLTDIKIFVDGLPPHWSDVYFNNTDRDIERSEGMREIRELTACLRAGLEEVVLAFGEYASGLGLTKKELREAREAIGRRQEIREV